MPKKLDPYEELGVPRDAAEQAICAGYRRRAKKTHPDAPGGSAEAFARVSRSLAVLTDPGARERYDRTGEFEEPKPDNKRAEAIAIIAKHLDAAIRPWLATCASDPMVDPRARNLIAEIKSAIRRDVAEAKVGRRNGERVCRAMEDLASRFGSRSGANDFVRLNLLAQVRANRAQLENIGRALELNALALELLDDVTFRPAPDLAAFYVEVPGIGA